MFIWQIGLQLKLKRYKLSNFFDKKLLEQSQKVMHVIQKLNCKATDVI